MSYFFVCNCSKPGSHFAHNVHEFGIAHCSEPGGESVNSTEFPEFE